MKKHFSIGITGRVQGVFFRASAKERAEAFSITGLVRNEPDGGVYLEAEGEEENLKKFIEWCHRGPSGARVETFDLREGMVKNYSRFLIER